MKNIRSLYLLSVIAIAATLSGCDNSPKNISEQYTLPDNMSDCSVAELKGKNLNPTLYVVHCPHADTHTSLSGKSKKPISVITSPEGEYQMTPREYEEQYNRRK